MLLERPTLASRVPLFLIGHFPTEGRSTLCVQNFKISYARTSRVSTPGCRTEPEPEP